ncbi:hypothetical protein E4T56_gene12816 [Termitomyces sp. T112]|nr:hypothetical protein E4T56_gene12816 [Termitomyces sp. T112]
MVFCLNPAKPIPLPRNLTSLDLSGPVRITSHRLPAQALSAQNAFKCPAASARGSRLPSKDSPSAAEPPGVLMCVGEAVELPDVPLIQVCNAHGGAGGVDQNEVCLLAEGGVVIQEEEDGSGGHGTLEGIEGCLLWRSPTSHNVLSSEKFTKPRNACTSFLPLGSGHSATSATLHQVHLYGSVQNDQAEILDLGLFRLTLLWFEVELVLVEAFQDKASDLTVFFQHFGVDENVVKVYTHYALCNEVLEDVVHHCLESGGAVGLSEEHNEWFKQSLVGLEGGLPFISFLDVHIVVAPLDIQFSEVLCTLEVVDELGDEEEGSEQAILLLHKEDQRSHQRLGRADVTGVQVLLQEGIKLILLPGC